MENGSKVTLQIGFFLESNNNNQENKKEDDTKKDEILVSFRDNFVRLLNICDDENLEEITVPILLKIKNSREIFFEASSIMICFQKKNRDLIVENKLEVTKKAAVEKKQAKVFIINAKIPNKVINMEEECFLVVKVQGLESENRLSLNSFNFLKTMQLRSMVQKFKRSVNEVNKDCKIKDSLVRSFKKIEKNEKKEFILISMRKGKHHSKKIKTKEGTFLRRFIFSIKVGKFDFGSAPIINLHFNFEDKDGNLFLSHIVTFNKYFDFQEKEYTKKELIVLDVDIIFRKFPLIVKVFDEKGKYFSNEIKLRFVEHFDTLFEKKQRLFKNVLKELTNNEQEKHLQLTESRDLEELPFEMLFEIFCFLTLSDNFKIKRVCSYFYSVCKVSLQENIKNWLIEKTKINRNVLLTMYQANDNDWKKVYKHLKLLSTKFWYSTNTVPFKTPGVKLDWLTKDDYDEYGTTPIIRRRYF